jgi:hypothetical protein
MAQNSETLPTPNYFARRKVAKVARTLLVRGSNMEAPLLAYTHDTGKHNLRSAITNFPWLKVAELTRNISVQGIDPYDACTLLAMAQASARNYHLSSVGTFQV